jgi:hypothetical protein
MDDMCKILVCKIINQLPEMTDDLVVGLMPILDREGKNLSSEIVNFSGLFRSVGFEPIVI